MHLLQSILITEAIQELWQPWAKEPYKVYHANQSSIPAAAATAIMWTSLFMEEQGYQLDKNILMQDNQSAILLELNGRRSAGKRSRALNIRYFFLTDQVEKGNLDIQYCPTEKMWGDYMTKPLQGEKFEQFCNNILGS